MEIRRLRKYRSKAWVREFFRENRLTPADFVQPIFLCEGVGQSIAIPTLPGIFRMSVDVAIEYVKRCEGKGILLFALFPTVEKDAKSLDAKEAFNPKNLMCRAIAEIKKAVPSVGLMGDVALDPYTSHGHDGIVVDDDVANDLTVEALVKQAKVMVDVGLDVIAPSDMMDGRIYRISQMLAEHQYHNTLIFSYSAKFNSAFYGPFRQAVKSDQNSGYVDKSTYQLSCWSRFEGELELEDDVIEGADALIIKPGLPYLDMVGCASWYGIPVLAYHVSGEYAMLKCAAENGILDYNRAIVETMVAFKRAGCSSIITYAAEELCALI